MDESATARPSRSLAGRGVLILDGATGTELSRRGVATGGPAWSAAALADDPDAIVEIHREALRAGAQVLTTCTFRTHARSLARDPALAGRSAELNAIAVGCARRARSAEGRADARIAGSLSPLEACFRPDLVPGEAACAREHADQAESLARAGADLLLAETMGTLREARAAVTAAVATGLETWCAFTTAAPGRLLSGEPLAVAVRAVEDTGASAVLINCVPAVESLAEFRALAAGASGPCGIYPNIGHARGVDGFQSDLLLEPGEFGAHLGACVRAGARLIGGCCGTTAEHVAAITALGRGEA